MSELAPGTKAMFVDEVEILVFGGRGGNGCCSFRREKFVPKGGPDGGNGGNGGSVYLQADIQYNTLQHLAGHHHWRAEHGGFGMGKNRHGKNGQDVIILVPPGTIVHDHGRGVVLKDLTNQDDSVCVATGGKGGRGNTAFKSPTNQTPRIAEAGTPGEDRTLHLELRLIADVGLVGKPNAGKSTLLSRLTAARPKIAAYPFTTLNPHLGIVELPNHRRFVMADLPGLIAGAHQGAGLGDAFLRHVERTRILVHLVDISPIDGEAVENYRMIKRELQEYSRDLSAKPQIVAVNKMDLTDSEDNLANFRKTLDAEVIPISAVTGRGLEQLAERIWDILHEDDSG